MYVELPWGRLRVLAVSRHLGLDVEAQPPCFLKFLRDIQYFKKIFK
jgi:hypothetical protein